MWASGYALACLSCSFGIGWGASASAQDRYDVVVVGSGAGGCAVANRLSRHADLSVVLLEAGGPDTTHDHIHDTNQFIVTSVLTPELDWGYVSEHELGLGRAVGLQQARMVGGCTSHNAGMWVHGDRKDFDLWAAAGNPGWDYASFHPYIASFETYYKRPNHTGEFEITHNEKSALRDSFFNAARAMGVPVVDDYNTGGGRDGISATQTNSIKGARQSAYRRLIHPLLKQRSNLHLKTHATVTKVLFNSEKRAVGVEYVDGAGYTHQVYANHQVVLAAGAYNSAKLLMLSGIGDENELKKFDIPVIHHLPGVGLNYRDHAFVFMFWLSEREMAPTDYIYDMLGFFSNDGTYDKHPADWELIAVARKGHEKGFPLGELEPYRDRLFSAGISLLHQETAGYVKLRSRDPLDSPRISTTYLQDERDIRKFEGAMKFLRSLVMHPEVQRDWPMRELSPGNNFASDRDFINQTLFTTWHPIGTCKMGPADDYFAVVDAELRVRGVSGLRVADASIIPQHLSGNTQAAIFGIGAKAAEFIANEWRARPRHSEL